MSAGKRLFDVVASGLALLTLSPVFVGLAIAVKFSGKGPVFYKQTRVGKDGEPFRLLKFRSMVVGADRSSRLTTAGDSRITKVGGFLRKSNLDELPQLLNVFVGKLSLVGPRPEVPEYVDLQNPIWQDILSIRPGMTSPETLEMRREGELLAKFADPEKGYREHVLPIKMAAARQYALHHSFRGDVQTMWKTAVDIVRPGTYSKSQE